MSQHRSDNGCTSRISRGTVIRPNARLLRAWPALSRAAALAQIANDRAAIV